MAIDMTAAHSRRALLAAAFGTGLATLGAALGRPQASRAANGDAVTVGGSFGGTAATTISRSGATTFNQPTIQGSSDGGTGVTGSSSTNLGVYGFSGSGIGVVGETSSGDGVVGETHGSSGTGVRGFATNSSGPTYGVQGSVSSPNGIAGYFEAPSAGTALQAVGKAKFSRSGRANVPAGKSYVDVSPIGGLGGSPNILATLQKKRSGVWVIAVRRNYPSNGKARIYLNKVASTTSSTPLAWFAFD